MHKQNPIESLNDCGKKPGLQIWVLRTVKRQPRPFSNLFHNNSSQKPPPEYEVFTVSPTKHGIFFTEDLYIVLKTHEGSRPRDIHFWFGKAYKETPPQWLDTFEDLGLDWPAVQHFEFQGYECEQFESYFHKIQPAIRYKRGRTPEPYSERLQGDTRFYRLECLDKTNYRVKEIPFNIALMTKEQCFILDTDYNTRSYVSDRTSADEREKSIVVSNRIREQDHEGNGDVEVVDLTTFSHDKDKKSIAKPAIITQEQVEPPEVDYDQPDEDPAGPQIKMHVVNLLSSDNIEIGYPPRFKYIPRPKKVPAKEEKEKKSFFGRIKKRVSTSFRRLIGIEVKPPMEFEIPSIEDKFLKQTVIKPYKLEKLESDKIYLLEGTFGKGVFLWVGKKCEMASKLELTECLRLEIQRCDQYQPDEDEAPVKPSTDAYTKKEQIVEKKLPNWTHVIKMAEGCEPVKFKRYFQDWK